MAEDLKSLSKKLATQEKQIADILKRLKFNEDRIKVLADSLTSEKDIEKLLDVHFDKLSREQNDNYKANTRRMELNEKRMDAADKAREKEMDQARKEAEAYADKAMKDFEKSKLEARLTVIEAKLASLGR